MDQLLGPKDVAAIAGTSTRTAQRLMRDGRIPAFRVGRKLWRTTRQALEAYAARELAESRLGVAR